MFTRAAAADPTTTETGRSIGLFAYAGSPPGRSALGERVWIGDLRNFSVETPGTSRGDFAVIAANGEEELLLAKGRFGGRPLFYAPGGAGQSLVACSRIGPLVAALEDSSLDLDALGAYLVWGSPADAEQTLYRRIRRVLPASAIRVGADGVRERRDLGRDVVPTRRASVDELAPKLRDRMNAAIERAFGTLDDVALGVSGGVDSSSLFAMALRLSRARGQPRVHGINLHYGGQGDDRPHLRELCDALHADVVRVRPEDCASMLLESLVIDGAPVPWPGAAFQIRLGRLARECGASVMLTGGGGDDVFNGDLRIFADRFGRGQWLSAVRDAARLKGLGSESRRDRVRTLVLYPNVRRAIGPRVTGWIRTRRSRAIPWAGPRLRDLGITRHGAVNVDLERERHSNRSFLSHLPRSRYYVWMKESMAQIELASGCTHVHPYMDDEFVEFLASIPPELFFHGEWVRGLFRHAMRGVIPEGVRTRRDKGRSEPALWDLVKAAGGFGIFEPLIAMTALGDLGLVEPKAFRRSFEKLAREPLNGRLWMELWPAITAEAFVRGLSRPS